MGGAGRRCCLAGLPRDRLQGSLHSISIEAFPFIQVEFPRFSTSRRVGVGGKGSEHLSRKIVESRVCAHIVLLHPSR